MRVFRVPTFSDFCGNRVGIGGTHGTRQILEALPARVAQGSVRAVSYTHLDVYKRQVNILQADKLFVRRGYDLFRELIGI